MHSFDYLVKNPLYILWLWLSLINLATFIAMGNDKYRAALGKWRIPEKTLIIMALLGGSFGGICGMYVFRHKTQHKKFSVGLPAILIIQIAIGYFIYLSI